MNPRPRNFLSDPIKLSSTENLVPTDADLTRTISRGMPGSAMPPWGHLPVEDLNALVAYVRHLICEGIRTELDGHVASGALTEEQAAEQMIERGEPGRQTVIPAEPEFNEMAWFRGRGLYLEACASCHGADGEPVAEAIKFDEEGYPVPPRSFVKGIFKGGSEGHQLYVRIVEGMAGTPMPAYEGVYSGDDIWALVHYIQSLARDGAQERSQLKRETIIASNIRGDLPPGPLDPGWDRARPVYVALAPLWWTENRIEGVVVQALHNDEELAIRLSWIDATADERAVKQDEFRDAVAIQFSLSSDPPFYMGNPGDHGGVNMWMWKADRNKNIADGYQGVDTEFPNRVVDMYPEQVYRTPPDAQGEPWPMGSITEHKPKFITAWGAGNLVSDVTLDTPVENLVAQGPGTLAGKPEWLQVVKGQAVYANGVWNVQMQRSLGLGDDPERAGDERLFVPGDYIPVSLAIWNGDAGDRDGKKNISIWQRLLIE